MTERQHSFFVIPTVHPAFALRGNEAWTAVIEKDLERAFRVAKMGWRYEPEIVIGHPQGNFPVAIRRLEAFFRTLDLSPNAQPISVDTETDGRDQHTCHLRAIAFSQIGTLRAASIAYSRGVWGTEAFNWIRSWLFAILASPTSKVAQNWPFDKPVLDRHGLSPRGQLLDTLPAHHTIESDLPHDLGFIAQRWLDVDPWKRAFDEQQKKSGKKWHDADWNPLLLYNGRDALETGRLWPVLTNEIQTNVPRGFDILGVQLWAVDLATRMSKVGLPLHEPTRQQLSTELHAKVDRAVALIRATMSWPEFNPRRKADRRELLYRRLGLQVRKYTPKNSEPSTSYKAIVEHAHIPAVRALIEHDETASLLSNVVDKYVLLPDGRLHVTWNTTGTDGSRWSSSPNLQNWPKFPINVRNLVQAPPGRVFVIADYAQLELRILAAFAGAQQLLRLFKSGEDAHGYVATQVFGERFTNADPRTKKALRDLTKRVVYGMQYGAGAPKVLMVLMEDKRVSVEVRSLLNIKIVDRVMRTFLALNPEVNGWRDRTLDHANRLGFLQVPPFGRVRRFLALPIDGPKAWNWPIQTCGHDFLLRAMYIVDCQRPPTAHILTDGHDEMVVECNEQDGARVKELVERAMYSKLDGPGGPVDLIADARVGRSWAETT